jgi:hypothetical protein|tara:strand:- start:156 stop:440 length:285 start_codon:yes stop_codon:yes gene_type:complete
MHKPNYVSEHTLFTFQPTDDADYEVWEDMDIGKKVSQYTEWFRKNSVNPKKYNFKKYINGHPMETDRAIGVTEGYVTVQIYDRKIDTLFRLTWL